jgi:hypothetical protein
MSDNLINLQHSSKKAASFSHAGASFTSDEDGIIAIPAHFAGVAKSHGFSVSDAPKAVKGGRKEPDEDSGKSDPASVAGAPESDEEAEKTIKEDAPKAVKGGRR